MASVTYRCHRKLANGSYEVVHSETESGVVVRPNEETVEQTLKKTLRMKNAEDVVPGFHATIDADTLQGKTIDEILADCASSSDLESVKTSVSEGKKLIAAAVTDKGVETAADATFKTMADNIESIAGIDIIDYKIKASSTSSITDTSYSIATTTVKVYKSSSVEIPDTVKKVMHYSLYSRSSEGDVIGAWLIDYEKDLAITMTLRGNAIAIKTYKLSENDTIQLHGSVSVNVTFTYDCKTRKITHDYNLSDLSIWYQY